jgi:hypothetical protein
VERLDRCRAVSIRDEMSGEYIFGVTPVQSQHLSHACVYRPILYLRRYTVSLNIERS